MRDPVLLGETGVGGDPPDQCSGGLIASAEHVGGRIGSGLLQQRFAAIVRR